MHFKRLNIGGFGRLPAGLELVFSQGLNLVLAPNEAGKTTLGDLISGLFYGYGKRKAGVHPYEPWSGGETGAELEYALDDGQTWSLSRHLQSRGEELIWRDAAGRKLEGGNLNPGEKHLGLARGVFGTVSRIRLDDLAGAFAGENQKEQRETQSALLGFFFREAATKGQVANPVELRQAWQDQAMGLYSKDRRRGAGDKAVRDAIAQAKEELARARAMEAEAAADQSELERIKERLEKLNKERKAAAAKLEQAQKEAARAQLAARRQKLNAEMAQIVAQGLADEASAQRARELEANLKKARRTEEENLAEAEQEKRRADETLAGRSLEELEPQLARAERSMTAMEVRQADLEAKASKLDRQAAALQEQWGQQAASLAALPEDLPLELERSSQELAQVQARAQDAQAVLDGQEAPSTFPANFWMPGLVTLLAGLGLAGVSAVSLTWDAWFWTGLILAMVGAGASAAGRHCRSRLADYQAKQETAQRAAGRVQAVEDRVHGLCAAVGIEPDTRPSTLAEALNKAQAWRQGEREMRRDRQEIDRELLKICGVLKLAPGSGLEAISSAINEQRALAASARELHEKSNRCMDQAKTQAREAQAAGDELKRLMAGAGVESLEALWAAADRTRKVRELSVVKAELDQQLGGGEDERAFLHLEQAAQNVDQARAGLTALDRDLARLEQKRGGLQEALLRLKEQTGAAQVEDCLLDLENKRRDLARRHDSLLLAGELLDRAMDQYRLEAQPSLLKRAGEYLEVMTGGVYAWLGSDLFQAKTNQPPRLSARPGAGQAERQAEVLSRGTRDQLYLCLRLALADEITSGSESLPLILDDPLVNFDDARLESALRLLGRVAESRQVILLTCHSEQAGLLDGLPFTRLFLQGRENGELQA